MNGLGFPRLFMMTVFLYKAVIMYSQNSINMGSPDVLSRLMGLSVHIALNTALLCKYIHFDSVFDTIALCLSFKEHRASFRHEQRWQSAFC